MTTELETLEIPVTPGAWSLAFAFEHDARKAQRVAELYEAATADARSASLLARWLDERVARIPSAAVVQPWITARAHYLVSRVEGFEPLPPDLPNPLRLPCSGCRYVFESRLRGGRYGRLCGECFAYEPREPAHPRGGLVMFKPSACPRRRSGQTLGVAEYGTSIVCAHPDCLELVLVAGKNRDYCREHVGRREQARRLRRVRPSKLERFAFVLAPGVNAVSYAWGIRVGEAVDISDGAPRSARDEEELLTLVQLAAAGHLTIIDSEPVELVE